MAESSRKSLFYSTALALVLMALCVSGFPSVPFSADKRPSSSYMGVSLMCKVNRRNCRGGMVFKRLSDMMDPEKALEDRLRQQQQQLREEDDVSPFSEFLQARRQAMLRNNDNDIDNDISSQPAAEKLRGLLGRPLRTALLKLLRREEELSSPQR